MPHLNVSLKDLVDACSYAELEELVKLAQNRRNALSLTLNEEERRLVSSGDGVQAIINVKDRLNCSLVWARSIVDLYREKQRYSTLHDGSALKILDVADDLIMHADDGRKG